MVMDGKFMKKMPLITNGLVSFFPQKLIDILFGKPSETNKEVEEGTRILPRKQITLLMLYTKMKTDKQAGRV